MNNSKMYDDKSPALPLKSADRKKIDSTVDMAKEAFSIPAPVAKIEEPVKAEAIPAKIEEPGKAAPVNLPAAPVRAELNKPKENKQARLPEFLEQQTRNVYKAGEIELIKATVAKGTSDIELAYFLSVAKGIDLNPLTKEIWCIKRTPADPPLIFASRDGFHLVAQRSPDFVTLNACEVREGDTFTMGTKDGEITISHQFSPGKDRIKKAILGAYAIVKVYRNGIESKVIEWADFDRYNKKQSAWGTHPEEMVKKVAEVHAIKKMANISGIYTEEEFDFEDEEKPKEKPKRAKKSFEAEEPAADPINPPAEPYVPGY